MRVELLRKLLRTVVAGSLTVAVVTQPAISQKVPSHLSQAGCYPIGYRCGTIKDWEVDYVLGNSVKPITYEDCVKLCDRQARNTYPPGTDQKQSSTGIVYVENSVSNCNVVKNDKAQEVVRCEFAVNKRCDPAGRRPDGLEQQASTEVTHVGEYFAQMAYLEEAAVTAFEHLVRELKTWGAPAELVTVAEEAVQEEIEHAEMVKALARRYGAAPLPVEVAPFRLRPLFEIAVDNATEGCVRETFGALSATWQALHAEDEAVRAVTERIVYEESRHSALSWDIHEWMKTQLSSEEWEQCVKAQQQAVDELEEMLQEDVPPVLVKIAGIPPKEQALEMFGRLKQELWV
jgi:rubrerythrin